MRTTYNTPRFESKSKLAILPAVFIALAASRLLAEEPQPLRGAAATPTSASVGRNTEEPLEQQKARMKATVEMFEDRVRRRLADFDELAKSVDLRKLEPQKTAVATLRQALADLDLGAQEILDTYARLGPDLRLYRQALEQAPGVFSRIADDLDRKALAKRSTMLKEAYADFSAQSRKLAASYAEKAKAMDSLEADIDRRIDFMRESREFVSDCDGLLAAIPTDSGIETEKLVQRLNSYITVLESTLKAVRTLGDKITEPESSDGSKSTTRDSQPQASQEHRGSKNAGKLADYRRRLDLLNK